MNDNIQKLYENASLVDSPTGTRYSLPDEFVEKFAELIVRECINIGDNYEEILGSEPECFNCRKVAYGIVDQIKKHFGVEK